MSLNPPFRQPKVFKPPFHGQSISCDGKQYFIGVKLGCGSFGEVFECTDEWGNQLVAKVLVPRRGQTYTQVCEQWQQELQKLLVLRHPNITYIHAAFEYDDTFYLVIERCQATLDSIIHLPNVTHQPVEVILSGSGGKLPVFTIVSSAFLVSVSGSRPRDFNVR